MVLTFENSGETYDSHGIPAVIEACITAEGRATYNINAYRLQSGLSFVAGDPLLHQYARIRSE